MALKDWKKSQTSSGFYKKIDNRGNYLKITFKFKSYFRRSPWVLTVERPKENSVLETEFFKTKTQALRFAKAYMRKH